MAYAAEAGVPPASAAAIGSNRLLFTSPAGVMTALALGSLNQTDYPTMCDGIGVSVLPADYRIRLVEPRDYQAIIEICRLVYPTEQAYTLEELEDHRQVFPQGQFAAVDGRNAVAGVSFTLRLRMLDYHLDDPWDVLTSGGSFLDHNPEGPTLYGADIMVHPGHQHRGVGRALTEQARLLVQEERLWRMVGASRLPGYGRHASAMNVEQYVDSVLSGKLLDPVLSIHIKNGWTAVRPIHGYLQHDEESVGWAEVIQWVNPACPPPPEFDLRKLPLSRLPSRLTHAPGSRRRSAGTTSDPRRRDFQKKPGAGSRILGRNGALRGDG